MSNIFGDFRRLVLAALDDLVETGALSDMSGGGDDIDRQLAQLGSGSEVDAQLASMKAQLGHTDQKQLEAGK